MPDWRELTITTIITRLIAVSVGDETLSSTFTVDDMGVGE
jgi:hypothetical protein